MQDGIKNLAQAKGNAIHFSPADQKYSYFITESNPLGQAGFAPYKFMLTYLCDCSQLPSPSQAQKCVSVRSTLMIFSGTEVGRQVCTSPNCCFDKVCNICFPPAITDLLQSS